MRQLLVRADSAFWSRAYVTSCVANQACVSMARPTPQGRRGCDRLDRRGRLGRHQLSRQPRAGRRRRVGPMAPDLAAHRQRVRPATMLDDCGHHVFVTNRPGTPVELDVDQRAHASVELAIRDLKHGAGVNRMPSRHFQGNAALVVACTLAHNLVRWTQLLTNSNDDVLRTSTTFRPRARRLRGRLVTSGRRLTLRLPTRWPWRTAWQTALADLRAPPMPCRPAMPRALRIGRPPSACPAPDLPPARKRFRAITLTDRRARPLTRLQPAPPIRRTAEGLVPETA
jgi:hypothetical protein